MNKIKYYLTAILLTLTSLMNGQTSDYVRVQDGQFVCGGKPYYYIGANFWYGAILGSTGQGGDRDRLIHELDLLKANGMTNLRVMIGADGPNGVPSKVQPTLQIRPGVYNDTIFEGLDFLMAEMGKRGMKAVLFFTNSWEWSGGYGQYLEWSGKGKSPIPAIDGWSAYMAFVRKYATCRKCTELLKKHIRFVMTRTNRYSGVKYTEDPAIFSWEIGNEPRAFSDENKKPFARWLREVSAYIKSLDKNHMVTIGTEGEQGCEKDIRLFEETHSDPNIDYMVMHIWPKNWGWLNVKDFPGTIANCIAKTDAYMKTHEEVALRLKKPIVLEEFGFPRDHHTYVLTDGTNFRDAYYTSVFERILESAGRNGILAGCNIWAWGGQGRPANLFWKLGDDYLGDPAQEEQGLNSVFDTDSTVRIIRKYTSAIKEHLSLVDRSATPETKAFFRNLKANVSKGIMFGHQDDPAYGHDWFNQPERSDVKETAGDYPAVVGWELGGLDVDRPRNLDSIDFKDMKRLMREVFDRGSVNTISWHGFNIATGGDAWDCKQDSVVRSILPGGIHHEAFLKRLDKLADFFQSLKNASDNPIPVIFRMYHEMSGAWFWWGSKQCTPEEYKKLYRMTVHYLRDVKHVHNLLYAYSPSHAKDEATFLNYYPGDEWVDVVGLDCYVYLDATGKGLASYKQSMTEGLKTVTAYAERTGKLAVMAETGLEGVLIPDYFTSILGPLVNPHPICYVLLWRNAYSSNLRHHFYVPFAGHPTAEDFRAFTKSNRMLMSKDVNLYRTTP